MYISIKECFEHGFRKWSDAHPSASNDNPTDIPAAGALIKPPEVPRDPWLVPGMRNTL
jgi:hypothetical protein